MMKKFYLFLGLSFSVFIQKSTAQTSYFPPLNGDSWEAISSKSLGWCEDKIDSLYAFLDNENTKGFMVLKDGKIVLEKYFGTFTKDSSWYWASAGKSLTSFMIGQALDENLFKIDDTVSTYLGNGWTSCTKEQEEKITIKNLLTMTSGLDELVADNSCTLPICLKYKADAGTRWAYHTAAYTQLQTILAEVSGVSENVWTQNKIKAKTGMNGLWVKLDYNHVYFSNVRSFSRFGILMLNKGKWNGEVLLKDTNYYHQMINASQSLNHGYGYLWWLNESSDFMLPYSQIVFKGSYAPNAPKEMYAAIGKNGQILSIVPSQNLIMVRMGEPSDNSASDVSVLLCNNIWEKLNDVICTASGVNSDKGELEVKIYPNPAKNEINIDGVDVKKAFQVSVFNQLGQTIFLNKNISKIDISQWVSGIYFIEILQGNKVFKQKMVKE